MAYSESINASRGTRVIITLFVGRNTYNGSQRVEGKRGEESAKGEELGVAVAIAVVMLDNHFGRTAAAAAAAPSNKRNSMHKMTTFSFGIL